MPGMRLFALTSAALAGDSLESSRVAVRREDRVN